MQTSFHDPRSQNSRYKICADTQRLKLRSGRCCGSPTIQARDQACVRPLKLCNDCAQIIRLHANVAVVHKKDFVSGNGNKLSKTADFTICAKLLVALHYTHPTFRKFIYQFLENWNRGIVCVTDSEQNLIIRI